MDEEKIKASFEKVRQDIAFLSEQLLQLREEITLIKANLLNKSSIGNEGVTADRQTDKPTHNRYSALVEDEFSLQEHIPTHNPTHHQHSNTKIQHISKSSPDIRDITELVNTLKNDLKRCFRSLTKQEFYIFSVLFTVDKSQNSVTYKDISLKTGLSESSVRDYIQRIIKKGVPIEKEKVNNKITVLKVPQEIRNLATFDNLLRLRNHIPDSSLDSFSSEK